MYKGQGVLSFSYFKRMMSNRIEAEIFIHETKGISSNGDYLEYWNTLYNCCKNAVSS